MQYFLYAIGKKEELYEPFDNCYIGVTNKLEGRWRSHLKSKYTVGDYIRRHNLSFTENMIVIFVGSAEDCFNKEKEYRPITNMGLNEAIGGHGGYTQYSNDRNSLISQKLKGRKIEWKDKISDTRKESGIAKGHSNPNAKKWVLTSPDGIDIMIHGNLNEVCEKHGILVSCLTRYIGSEVPPISTNGFGGYRAKSETSEKLRKNSTGWKLNRHNGG